MIKKHTQNNVDEPGPQLVVEPPPQGQFPLSAIETFVMILQARYVVLIIPINNRTPAAVSNHKEFERI